MTKTFITGEVRMGKRQRAPRDVSRIRKRTPVRTRPARHYTPQELRSWSTRDLPEDLCAEIEAHLADGCEECLEEVQRLPPLPRRVFGRPVPTPLFLDPVAIEKQIREL